MTLYDRNVFFRVEILIAGGFLILAGILALQALPACPVVMAEAVKRSPGIIQGLARRLLAPNPFVPFASLAAAALFSLAALILIYFFFEKTQAPEILFITLFVLSFSFEVMRLMTLLQKVWVIPSIYLLLASRILLFGRLFGIFSLFAASVYAAGLEVRKQRNVILVITVATLIIALGVPIDTQTWDSSLNMINGYTSLFRLLETGVVLITVISFFIAAYSRRSEEYTRIGAGAFLAFLGRNLFLNADTWISPVPGILLLSVGIWFICTQLHKIYLWL